MDKVRCKAGDLLPPQRLGRGGGGFGLLCRGVGWVKGLEEVWMGVCPGVVCLRGCLGGGGVDVVGGFSFSLAVFLVIYCAVSGVLACLLGGGGFSSTQGPFVQQRVLKAGGSGRPGAFVGVRGSGRRVLGKCLQ
jgi:hypothetical protein